jgi:hypothetical protein
MNSIDDPNGCSDLVNSKLNPIWRSNYGISNTLQLRDSVGVGTNLSPLISMAVDSQLPGCE